MPVFFASFILFGFGRAIFYKLNLVNQNSIGKMYEFEDDEEDVRTQGSGNRNASLEFMEIEMTHKI